MIEVRRAGERGHANQGWLDSHHTFSFSDYRDPRYMGFRDLRVINEDLVQPSKGFGTHGHRDMEIISYVLRGELAHQDSMGNGSIIRPGDVQRMSAGKGVKHSEHNPSPTDPVHFLQIWILPAKTGSEPGYEQKHFSESERKNQLRLIASRSGRDGSITVHQEVDLFASILDAGASVQHSLKPGKHAWLQVARGSVELNGKVLTEGDGASMSDEETIAIRGVSATSEVLVFDLK